MALWQWSTTPANNATAGLINWAEGQAPSTVNDSARQMMADVAALYSDPEWYTYGDTPTYVSGTQFTVPTNRTGTFTVGRRVRAHVSAGTVSGTVTASVYTSVTTVTLALDSGALDSSLSQVDVGQINPISGAFPQFASITLNAPGDNTGSLIINAPNATTTGANVALKGDGATTPNKYIRSHLGVLQVVNSAYNGILMTIDDSGNLTAVNVTASSDERLKKDWADLPDDFLDLLAGVKCGAFTRVSSGERQVGVSAQSLRAVMPDAVVEDKDGYLSVAYGNAALVAVIELAREVRRLRALLEPVK